MPSANNEEELDPRFPSADELENLDKLEDTPETQLEDLLLFRATLLAQIAGPPGVLRVEFYHIRNQLRELEFIEMDLLARIANIPTHPDGLTSDSLLPQPNDPSSDGPSSDSILPQPDGPSSASKN